MPFHFYVEYQWFSTEDIAESSSEYIFADQIINEMTNGYHLRSLKLLQCQSRRELSAIVHNSSNRSSDELNWIELNRIEVNRIIPLLWHELAEFWKGFLFGISFVFPISWLRNLSAISQQSLSNLSDRSDPDRMIDWMILHHIVKPIQDFEEIILAVCCVTTDIERMLLLPMKQHRYPFSKIISQILISSLSTDSQTYSPIFNDSLVLRWIALHCIALHGIALHGIALHCIALHCANSTKIGNLQRWLNRVSDFDHNVMTTIETVRSMPLEFGADSIMAFWSVSSLAPLPCLSSRWWCSGKSYRIWNDSLEMKQKLSSIHHWSKMQ
jgi:hypothetical protein